jgi:hypothetical protein
MSTPYRAPDDPRPPPPEEPAPTGLGDLRSTHKQKRIVGKPLLLAAGFALFFSAFSLWGHNSAPFVVGVSIIAFALVPVWLLSELLVGLGSAVEVWDDGIVVRRRWTDDATLRWDEIDALYIDYEVASGMLGVYTVPTAKLTLTTHEGRRVVIPRGLTGTPELLAAVDRHVERPLLAPARRALAAGEPLTFGPVVLDGDGMTAEGKTIRWDDLERIEVEPDHLFVHEKSSRWHSLNLDIRDLPHPRVLVQLLASRAKTKAHAIWSE